MHVTMSKMSVRATYALDEETARRIKRLAREWGVSQAEVIRRSVERAAAKETAAPLTPADVIAHYAREPMPRTKSETKRLVTAMRRLRHDDDVRRGRGD
jgi:hypothetical protein